MLLGALCWTWNGSKELPSVQLMCKLSVCVVLGWAASAWHRPCPSSAMSTFTHTEQQVQQLADTALKLQQQYDELSDTIEKLRSELDQLTTSASVDTFNTLDPLHTSYNTVQQQHAHLQPIMEKYSLKAAEKDPDKQLYGSKQVKRIEASQRQFDSVTATLRPLAENFLPLYLQIKQTVDAVEDEKRQSDAKAEAAAAAEREAASSKQRALDDEQAAIRAVEEQKLAKQREIDAKRDYERKLAADEERREKEEADRTERIRRERAVREQEERAERQREAEALKIKQQQQQRERQARIEQDHQQQEKTQQQRLTMEEQKQAIADSLQQVVSQNSKTQADGAMTTVLKYINNVLENPMNAEHRSIRSSDSSFQQYLADIPGGAACVEAVGFQSQSASNDCEQEYVLKASAEAWTLLTAARKMVEEQLLDVRSDAT